MALLDGHRALVTGAGSGIGRAVALRLHADGATVAVLDVDGDAARRVAHQTGSGPVLVADVADGVAVEEAVQQATRELGGLTILVNNAGVGAVKHLHRYRDSEYDRIVDVSMRGTFHGLRSAVPIMMESGGGSIVNMASISGIRPTRGEAPYSAAKAAVIALTQSAALEYGPTVRVNCVSPGLIETPLTQPLLGDEKAQAGFARRTPLGRTGTAEEVAAVVAFLCSDMASYITGVNLPVDGGSLLPSAQVEGILTSIVAESD
jgi:NAD(P)-dependent dehydrogenase (short-subunit alcohol dehydrogenase family)